MATEVLMPQMGESIAEGTITKWRVKVGDSVERDQPLLEISTDKVDAEIPSPASGVLLEIKHQEGETVGVNQVIALVGESGEKGGAAVSPVAPAGAPATPAAPATSAAAPAAPTSPPAPSPEGEGSRAPAASAPAPAAGSLEERVRQASSPLVRSIAKAEGVDITQLHGSGIHGRVTKADILGYLDDRKSGKVAAPATPAMSSPAPAGAPAPAKAASGFHVPAYYPGENVVIEPMSKMRQITAAHMRYSKDTSAHVTTVFHMDMSKVHAARERSKAGFLAANGTKLSYMPFIFKAVCAALKANPKLNAAIDGTNVVFKKDINLGMAVALDWGLIVPVIRRADELSLLGVARAINDLGERARTRKLNPDEVQRGTFTITNPGVFGSVIGTPIINQPQVAILCIGSIEKQPAVITVDGSDTLAIRTRGLISLAFDHRIVDGADADRFMADVKTALQSFPETAV
jgi:2-oxoglutarate dehydrogenase E2 component (dihydrolipoamide succinyltransferase)